MIEPTPEIRKGSSVRTPIARWLRKNRIELLLFLLLWTTYSYFYQATGDNEATRLDQLRALVEDHTVTIDKYWWNTADVIRYPNKNGSVYPNKAPGTTLLFAPAYAIASKLLTPLRALGVPEWVYWHLVVYVLTIFTISLFSALSGVALYRVVLRLSGDQYLSSLAVLAIWLGTLLFPFSTMFFGHVVAASLLIFAFYLLFKLRRSDGLVTPARISCAGGAGFLLSLSVVTEYPSAVAVVVISIYAAWIASKWKISLRHKSFFAAAFISGGVLGAALLIGYNCVAFGKPFYIPYESYAKTGEFFSETYSRGWMGMQWMGIQHFISALGAIVLFPPIGLLYLKIGRWGIYACNPVLWLSLPGFVIMFRRRRLRPEAFLVAGLAAAYLVFLTSYGTTVYDWSGASYLGPRHLIPLLPFLALPLCFGAARFRWLFYPLLGLSIFYMLLATATEPRVPLPSDVPARDQLLPDYLHGLFAQNAHHLFDSGDHLLTRDSTAFNLAKIAGVYGRVQLVPLMFWWSLLGVALVYATREPKTVGQSKAGQLDLRRPNPLTTSTVVVLCTSAIAFAPIIYQLVTLGKDTSHGLLGKYYRNATWSGAEINSQVDPMIDFDWGRTMPLPPPFSVQWTGQLLIEQPGEYKFSLAADDGASLEIDGDMVIGSTSAFQEKDGQVDLTEGSHSIRIRYFNSAFGGFVRVWWTPPGRQVEILPRSVLVPERMRTNVGTMTSTK